MLIWAGGFSLCHLFSLSLVSNIFDMEIWKKIEGFNDVYEVSNFGKVRSSTRLVERTNPNKPTTTAFYTYKEREVKAFPTNKGYLRIGLYLNGVKTNHQVHRLVSFAFIDNQENKEQVNHINGDKTDNRVENLEWCTNMENYIHSVSIGRQKHSYKI